jgi:hypothetical protein
LETKISSAKFIQIIKCITAIKIFNKFPGPKKLLGRVYDGMI